MDRGDATAWMVKSGAGRGALPRLRGRGALVITQTEDAMGIARLLNSSNLTI